MKILQITRNYYPEKTGIAVTSTELAEWLASRGDSVTVITSLPYYPEWKIDPEYRKNRSRRKECINLVVVHRATIYVPKSLNTLLRMLHEISFVITAIPKAFKVEKPDVIILVSPPLFIGYL